MIEEIISQDRAIFLYLNSLGSLEFDAFWIFVSGKFSWFPLYIGLLYFLYQTYNKKQLGYILLFLFLGILVSDQISNVFKFGFERLRPCHDKTIISYMRIVECGGKYGFYSAHASNTFLLASFLSPLLKNKYKGIPVILFVWASMVAYSRIYLGVHFPLDIFVGAIIGFLIGKVFIFMLFKILNKFNV